MPEPVTFTGFRTMHQAQTFANWYSGAGEQVASLWMEEHAGVTSCDAKKIQTSPSGVIVALSICEKTSGKKDV